MKSSKFTFYVLWVSSGFKEKLLKKTFSVLAIQPKKKYFRNFIATKVAIQINV